MMSSPARALIGLVAVAVALGGCTATTGGSGTVGSSAASSAHDFPSVTGTGTIAVSPPPASVSPSGPPQASTHPVPSAPLKTVTVHAAGARTYVVEIWAHVHNATCFDHAYGTQMIEFLIKHPCQGLDRYLGTTTVNGNPAAFAESVTAFSGTASDPYTNSAEFTRLEKTDGTGSIKDLLREGYRLPLGPTSVPSSEAFDVIGQDNGVTVWDAWYVGDTTPPNDPSLLQMMKDIFLQF